MNDRQITLAFLRKVKQYAERDYQMGVECQHGSESDFKDYSDYTAMNLHEARAASADIDALNRIIANIEINW